MTGGQFTEMFRGIEKRVVELCGQSVGTWTEYRLMVGDNWVFAQWGLTTNVSRVIIILYEYLFVVDQGLWVFRETSSRVAIPTGVALLNGDVYFLFQCFPVK